LALSSWSTTPVPLEFCAVAISAPWNSSGWTGSPPTSETRPWEVSRPPGVVPWWIAPTVGWFLMPPATVPARAIDVEVRASRIFLGPREVVPILVEK
jgi:hypothetical protein